MTEQPGEGEPGALRLPRTPSGRFARRRLTPHRIPARPASPGSRPLRVRRAPPGAARAEMRPDRSSAVCGGERGIFPKSGEVSQEINRGYIRLYMRVPRGTHLDRANAIRGGEGNTKTERKMSSKKVALKHLKLSGWMRTVRRVVFLIERRCFAGKNGGTTQQGGGCGKKWGSFPENGKALREKAGCLMGKGRNGEEKQIGKGDGDAGGN